MGQENNRNKENSQREFQPRNTRIPTLPEVGTKEQPKIFTTEGHRDSQRKQPKG